MRQKPWVLIFWPIIFVAIAISLPAQIMWLYGHSLSEFDAVLGKLTVFNWLVMLGLFANAFGVSQARPWVRYTLPLLILAVAMNNFFVGYVGTDFSSWTALGATIAFIGMNVPLASQELVDLFNNPARAWWREAERKEIHVPVKLDGLHDLRLKAETFDVSATGMFVPLKNEEYAALKDNEHVSVCLIFNRVSEFRCDGRVVRHSPGNGHYPQGIGIQFVGLTWSQQNELTRYLKRQVLQHSNSAIA
jgi:hypothetical protein